MSGRTRYSTDEERKAARRASAKKWAEANREKHRAAVKRCRQTEAGKEAHRASALRYAAKNREQERVRAAEWRVKHPEKALESYRTYYLNNKKVVCDKAKIYREANAESFKEWCLQYKGRKRAGGGRLTKGYMKRLMDQQNGTCNACRCDLSISGRHVDHILALSRGGLHCDANVQLLCPSCNRRKSTKNFDDFLMELQEAK